MRLKPTADGAALGITPDTVSFSRDMDGQVNAERGANGGISMTRDAPGNITALTLPGEQRLSWLYYGSGHVSAIRFNSQLVSEFTRDRLHRETSRSQGARLQTRQYDSLGRRVLQQSRLHGNVTLPEQALLQRQYRYTARHELAAVSDTLRGDEQFSYDAEGYLQKHYEARQGHATGRFDYDAAGNLREPGDPAPVSDNRLTHWQGLFMAYDAWGNLTRRRSGLHEQHYRYDAENRLIQAEGTGPEGTFTARYHYDALGRRTRKTVTTRHGTTDTRFLWQGFRLLQEQHEHGQCRSYVYDPDEAWSPLARIDHQADSVQGEIFWFGTDLNGAPLEMTDEAGQVCWSGHYGAFGEVKRQTAGYLQQTGQHRPVEQPLRYAGQYADSETGLHYNLFRYYDPHTGRFTVQDPIGTAGGWNLYLYTPNPLTWVDPWGLTALDAPGYTVYGLYDKGATEPYYVGISNDTKRRALEHMESGRLSANGDLRPLERNVNYGQSRGYEQYYIEKYETKTGKIGQDISETNRGNKVNSYDHARTDARAEGFREAYNSKKNPTTGGKGCE